MEPERLWNEGLWNVDRSL